MKIILDCNIWISGDADLLDLKQHKQTFINSHGNAGLHHVIVKRRPVVFRH